MMRQRKPLHRSRRNFLFGAGGTALCLPLLEYFCEQPASAAPGGVPERFICMTHQQGWIPRLFWPTSSGGALQLPELLLPLAGYESQLLFVRGVDNRASQLNVLSDGHISAETTLLTCEAWSENIDRDGRVIAGPQQASFGVQGGPSFDRVLAERISADLPHPSLALAVGHFGDQPPESQTALSMKFAPRRGEQLEQIIDPRLTYAYLFGSSSGGDELAAQRLLARRSSVLDAVSDNFATFRQRLGREDRMRLDSHAEKIRGLERRLQSLSSCNVMPPSLPSGYNHIIDDHLSGPLQIELMVLALACGLSNVATLQFTDGHGNTFHWIDDPNPVVPPAPEDWDESSGEPPSGYSNWHDMVHRGTYLNGQDDDSEPGLVAGYRFYAEQMRVLLDALSATEDLGGCMLDSTCVLSLTEFSSGAWHDTNDLPIMVAGTMGTHVDMGRLVDLRPSSGANAYCTNQLFTSLLHAFGFADPSFGRIGSHSLQAGSEVRQVDLLPGALPL